VLLILPENPLLCHQVAPKPEMNLVLQKPEKLNLMKLEPLIESEH
jgi:hypothetical protein